MLLSFYLKMTASSVHPVNIISVIFIYVNSFDKAFTVNISQKVLLLYIRCECQRKTA